MDWFLYDRGPCHERVKLTQINSKPAAHLEPSPTFKMECYAEIVNG